MSFRLYANRVLLRGGRALRPSLITLASAAAALAAEPLFADDGKSGSGFIPTSSTGNPSGSQQPPIPPEVRESSDPVSFTPGLDAPLVPDELSTPPAGPAVPPPPSIPEMPDGLYLKKSTARYSLLAGQADEVGMDEIALETVIASGTLPPLTITPSFALLALDGPVSTDLPGTLYSGQLEARWFGRPHEAIAYEVAAIPSIFTDFDNTSSEAFRMQGRGLLFVGFSQQTQIALGAMYLDREDVSFLPIGGLLYQPREDLKFELLFPRPRILKRIGSDSLGENWAYMTGEFGGGSYAIRRANGKDDVITYRDYRLLFGLERRRKNSWTAGVEAGFVFGRELEYRSHRGDHSPDDTLMLRLSFSR